MDSPGQTTPPAVGDAGDAAMQAKLRRVVARACPAWASSHIDDIVQAAMIRMLRVQKKREGNDPLPASYLWKVGYTATIDELRKLRAKREVALADEDNVEPSAGAHLGPARRAESDEIAEGIRSCLAKLGEARRHAVTLYLTGHSVPEAARVQGWTTKRAENLVYRGLADLRACLSRKGLEP